MRETEYYTKDSSDNLRQVLWDAAAGKLVYRWYSSFMTVTENAKLCDNKGTELSTTCLDVRTVEGSKDRRKTEYHIMDAGNSKQVYWNSAAEKLVYQGSSGYIDVRENQALSDSKGVVINTTTLNIKSIALQERKKDREAAKHREKAEREERKGKLEAAETKTREGRALALSEIEEVRNARGVAKANREKVKENELGQGEATPFLDTDVLSSSWEGLPPNKRRFDSIATLIGFREVVGASAFDGETLWLASNYGEDKSTDAVLSYLQFVARKADEAQQGGKNASYIPSMLESLTKDAEYQTLLNNVFKEAFAKGGEHSELAEIESAKDQFSASAARLTESLLESFLNVGSRKALPPGAQQSLQLKNFVFIPSQSSGHPEHAEMKVISKILHKVFKEGGKGGSFYIGVSKPCCPSCMAMIDAVNTVLTGEGIEGQATQAVEFEVRGTHNKYYVTQIPTFMTDDTFSHHPQVKLAIQKAYIANMEKLFLPKTLDSKDKKASKGEEMEHVDDVFAGYHTRSDKHDTPVGHIKSQGNYGEERMAHRRSVSPINKHLRDSIWTAAQGMVREGVAARNDSEEKGRDRSRERSRGQEVERDDEVRSMSESPKKANDESRSRSRHRNREAEKHKKKKKHGEHREGLKHKLQKEEVDKQESMAEKGVKSVKSNNDSKGKDRDEDRSKGRSRGKVERDEEVRSRSKSPKKANDESRSRSRRRNRKEEKHKKKHKHKSRRSRSNLKRYEKLNLPQELGLKYNFGDKLIESAGQDNIGSLRSNSSAQAARDNGVLLAQVRHVEENLARPAPKDDKASAPAKNGSIELLPEINHGTNHSSNVDILIDRLKKREIAPGTVICLERKQYGKNLGMADVIMLADILKYNEDHKKEPAKQIKLPTWLKESSLIYKDAELYNAIRDYNATLKETEAQVMLIGIEGSKIKYSEQLIRAEPEEVTKELERLQLIDGRVHTAEELIGQDVGKDSILYDLAREEHMAQRLREIAGTRREVIFSVGTAHIENVKEQLRPIRVVVTKIEGPNKPESKERGRDSSVEPPKEAARLEGNAEHKDNLKKEPDKEVVVTVHLEDKSRHQEKAEEASKPEVTPDKEGSSKADHDTQGDETKDRRHPLFIKKIIDEHAHTPNTSSHVGKLEQHRKGLPDDRVVSPD